MNDKKEWREFLLRDLFPSIQRGKRLTKSNQKDGIKPYISSTAMNNGIDNYIENSSGVRVFSDCLTIANSGSVGSSFYHPYDFVASDHVTHLKNLKYSQEKYLFLATQTARLSEKYNFNREINDSRISREKIILPITKSGKPDWLFMEEYISSMIAEKKFAYIAYAKKQLEQLEYKAIPSLEEKEWDEFFIEEVGTILSGRDIYDAERTEGKTPYISSTSKNNGTAHFVGNSNESLEQNCLSVNRNGSVGYSFYHPYLALYSNDCRKIRLNIESKHLGFFIANQITKQKEKYNYGYKMGTGRLKRQKIMLPITKNGKPDYAYMEQYMRNLEYTKRKQYLDYVEPLVQEK